MCKITKFFPTIDLQPHNIVCFANRWLDIFHLFILFPGIIVASPIYIFKLNLIVTLKSLIIKCTATFLNIVPTTACKATTLLAVRVHYLHQLPVRVHYLHQLPARVTLNFFLYRDTSTPFSTKSVRFIFAFFATRPFARTSWSKFLFTTAMLGAPTTT